MKLSFDPFLQSELGADVEAPPTGSVHLANAMVIDQLFSYLEHYYLSLEDGIVSLWVQIPRINDQFRLALRGAMPVKSNSIESALHAQGRQALLEFWMRRPPFILYATDFEPGDVLDMTAAQELKRELDGFYRQFVKTKDENAPREKGSAEQ